MDNRRGFTRNTQQGLRDMDSYESEPAPPPKVDSWAKGTPIRPDQTARHPRTGAPMTQAEAEALSRALRKRKVPGR